jgi:hypothetical protein
MDTDIMTPHRMRLSVVLIGSGVQVGRLECDFDWNHDFNYRDPREHCTSNLDFELYNRGAISWLSHSEESLQVVLKTPGKPTHVRLDVDYEGGKPEPPYENYVLSDIHAFGPLTWAGNTAEFACITKGVISTTRSGELRCPAAAADQR